MGREQLEEIIDNHPHVYHWEDNREKVIPHYPKDDFVPDYIVRTHSGNIHLLKLVDSKQSLPHLYDSQSLFPSYAWLKDGQWWASSKQEVVLLVELIG